MESNQQTFTENKFTQAIHFQERLNYKELDPTLRYSECDVLLVDHSKKTFWFTTQTTLQHTKKVINQIQN